MNPKHQTTDCGEYPSEWDLLSDKTIEDIANDPQGKRMHTTAIGLFAVGIVLAIVFLCWVVSMLCKGDAQ